MATSMGRCVTDASTWTRPKCETSCSSINSLGLNLCLDRRTPSTLPVTGVQALAAGSFADG